MELNNQAREFLGTTVGEKDFPDLKSEIGSLIKKRRKKISMNQEDLRDYAEIGSTTLSNLEQGKANITLDVLEKIFEVLGLEIKVEVKKKGIK